MITIINAGLVGYWASFPIQSVFGESSIPMDDGGLLKNDRSSLESIISNSSKKLGITKEVTLVARSSQPVVASAVGTVAVEIDNHSFMKIERSEHEFILARELVHIKNNTRLKDYVLSGSVGVVTTVALCTFVSFSVGGIMAYVITCVVRSTFLQWREQQADIEAFSLCSKDTQKATIASLEKTQRQTKQHNTSFMWHVWLKSTDFTGDTGVDFKHPPLALRIKYFKAMMQS